MRVAVMTGPGEVRVENRPEPRITAPTDALIFLCAATALSMVAFRASGFPAIARFTPLIMSDN